MEPILFGTVLPGPVRIDDGNVNPTFKAAIQTSAGTTYGYFKLINPRAIVVEALCAVLGRGMNLPIPRPIIVQVDHGSLPSEVPDGTSRITFASQDVNIPSFKRLLNNSQMSQTLWQRLAACHNTRPVAVFDEWIVNYDRNQGNILFDGADDFWFIDHERALPANWPVGQPCNPNQLMTMLSQGHDEGSKYAMLRDIVTKELRSIAALDVDAAKSLTFSDSFLGQPEVASIVTFLKNRAPRLSSLLAANLGVDSKELPYERN